MASLTSAVQTSFCSRNKESSANGKTNQLLERRFASAVLDIAMLSFLSSSSNGTFVDNKAKVS
jgi:hypothetical protein